MWNYFHIFCFIYRPCRSKETLNRGHDSITQGCRLVKLNRIFTKYYFAFTNKCILCFSSISKKNIDVAFVKEKSLIQLVAIISRLTRGLGFVSLPKHRDGIRRRNLDIVPRGLIPDSNLQPSHSQVLRSTD